MIDLLSPYPTLQCAKRSYAGPADPSRHQEGEQAGQCDRRPRPGTNEYGQELDRQVAIAFTATTAMIVGPECRLATQCGDPVLEERSVCGVATAGMSSQDRDRLQV